MSSGAFIETPEPELGEAGPAAQGAKESSGERRRWLPDDPNLRRRPLGGPPDREGSILSRDLRIVSMWPLATEAV